MHNKEENGTYQRGQLWVKLDACVVFEYSNIEIAHTGWHTSISEPITCSNIPLPLARHTRLSLPGKVSGFESTLNLPKYGSP